MNLQLGNILTESLYAVESEQGEGGIIFLYRTGRERTLPPCFIAHHKSMIIILSRFLTKFLHFTYVALTQGRLYYDQKQENGNERELADETLEHSSVPFTSHRRHEKT